MRSTHTGITMIVKVTAWLSVPVTFLPLFVLVTAESLFFIATALETSPCQVVLIGIAATPAARPPAIRDLSLSLAIKELVAVNSTLVTVTVL